jgi:hypothetical protein
MGIHDTLGKIGQLLEGEDRRIGGNTGGQATEGNVVVIKAVAVVGRQFIFLRH